MVYLWMWSTLSLAPLLFHSILARPTQQPLLSSPHSIPDLPANYTHFELRRYGISSTDDFFQMIDLVNKANIDVWHLTPRHVDVHMDTTADLPKSLAGRRYTALPHSFPCRNNYTALALSNRPKIDLSSLQDNEFHRAYHTYEEIDQFAVALASQYPKLVEIVRLGASSEGRDVFALRIGKRRRGNKSGKKHSKHAHDQPIQDSWKPESILESMRYYAGLVIGRLMELGGLFSRKGAVTMRDLYAKRGSCAMTQNRPIKNRVVIQGAQHAREWIACAAALYIAHALVTPKNETGSLRYLLNDFDFTIIPVPNPDGYAYTWTTDRLWYKNRMEFLSDTPGTECRGVDMNRNWGYQ